MISIKVPIEDYADKFFKIKEEDMVVLPRRKCEIENAVEVNVNFDDDLDNIDGDEVSLLVDGFINGYIEGLKYVTKNLIKEEFTDSYIMELTRFSSKFLNKIKDELDNEEE